MNPLQILLLPFSALYGLITRLRNSFYDWGLFKSTDFQLPIIGVGNLRVGGTGKTPMIEYLIGLLATDFRMCTLSRGYGRKTSGFRLATKVDNARTIGDEPYQLFLKFKGNPAVAVGEDRVLAIPEILSRLPESQILLLDDVFQHRSVRLDLNILVTEYSSPFYDDHLLPMGRLREGRAGARRADVVVVTKCPSTIDWSEMDTINDRIKSFTPKNVPVFFSRIKYLSPVQYGGTTLEPKEFLLVTGIANDKPIEYYLRGQGVLLEHIQFADHHAYTKADIERIIHKWQSHNSGQQAVLTTEKDMARMLHGAWGDVPRFYLPIRMEFIQDQPKFDEMIRTVAQG